MKGVLKVKGVLAMFPPCAPHARAKKVPSMKQIVLNWHIPSKKWATCSTIHRAVEWTYYQPFIRCGLLCVDFFVQIDIDNYRYMCVCACTCIFYVHLLAEIAGLMIGAQYRGVLSGRYREQSYAILFVLCLLHECWLLLSCSWFRGCCHVCLFGMFAMISLFHTFMYICSSINFSNIF